MPRNFIRDLGQGVNVGQNMTAPIVQGIYRGQDVDYRMQRFEEEKRQDAIRNALAEKLRTLQQNQFDNQVQNQQTNLLMTPGVSRGLPGPVSGPITALPGSGGMTYSPQLEVNQGNDALRSRLQLQQEIQQQAQQPQIDEQNRVAGIALSPTPLDTQGFASGGVVSPSDQIKAFQLRGGLVPQQQGQAPQKKPHGTPFVEGGKTFGYFEYPNGSVGVEEIPAPERTGKATPAKLSEGERNLLLSAGNQKYALRQAVESYNKLSNESLKGPFSNFGLNPLTQSSVGPVPSAVNWMNNKVGYGSSEVSTFNTESKANLFNLARALQGAGVLTEQDVKRMEEIAPVGSQGREQFMGSVNGISNVMANRIKAFLDLNKARLSTDEEDILAGVLQELESVKGGGKSKTQPGPGIPTRTGRTIPIKPAK